MCASSSLHPLLFPQRTICFIQPAVMDHHIRCLQNQSPAVYQHSHRHIDPCELCPHILPESGSARPTIDHRAKPLFNSESSCSDQPPPALNGINLLIVGILTGSPAPAFAASAPHRPLHPPACAQPKDSARIPAANLTLDIQSCNLIFRLVMPVRQPNLQFTAGEMPTNFQRQNDPAIHRAFFCARHLHL